MSSEYIVEPAKIEHQLNAMWDLLRGKGKTRASLFNLVIYTEKNFRVDYLYSIAQKLIERFPSRILFVTIDGDLEKNTIKTSVSAISSESEQNSVACDFINILLSPDNKERAPFLLFPHLITDLPTYLLWGDDPTKKDPVAKEIEKLATRVIFDSELADDLSLFASSVMAHQFYSGSDVADLNWARIEGWRQLFAETFKTQDQLESLKKAQELHITYNCKGSPYFTHTKIQALYLQAWISTLLGWEFKSCKKSSEETRILYTHQSKEISIKLIPFSDASYPPGRIIEISLRNSAGEHYLFKRSKGFSHMIDIGYSTPFFCRLTSQFIFDKYESGITLVKEIFHKGTSDHFSKVLKAISEIKNKDLTQC